MSRRFPLVTMLVGAAVAMFGCAMPYGHNLPPAERLMEPGPGVGGPGPGVMPPMFPSGAMPAPMPAVQIMFVQPEAMHVQWDVSAPGMFDSSPMVVPGRQNFTQGGIYRLKLTNIPGRVGDERYPTLEIGPTTPRTAAYLAHNAIPIHFTEEDFDQVASGNFVTKVVYLPDPGYQELALAGVETLVSTRLDPGIDPITEADRRGAILAVVRMGNKDLEVPGDFMEAGPGFAMDGGAMPAAGMAAMAAGGGAMPANYVSGVTAPVYGMPTTGTPLGLPGPPHIPLGVPAGLQQHVMRNYTHVNMPPPTEKLSVHVRQQPGLSYPKPPDQIYVREKMHGPVFNPDQPHGDMYQNVSGQYGAEDCYPY